MRIHAPSDPSTGVLHAYYNSTKFEASPGALFWVLRNGSLKRGMLSFAHLPEAQRWQIITYLKTLKE